MSEDNILSFDASRAKRRASKPVEVSSDNVIDICNILAETVWSQSEVEEAWGGPPLIVTLLAAEADRSSYAGHIAWVRKLAPALTRIAFKGALDEDGFEAVDRDSDALLAAIDGLTVPFAVPSDIEDEKRIVRERVAALLERLTSLERWGEIAVDACHVSEVEFDRTSSEVYASLNGLEAFGK